MPKFDDQQAPSEEVALSKTQRKKLMHEKQALGEQLLDFSTKELASLNLTDNLLEAIAQAKKMQSNNAKRRQLQYIGKLMRKVDTLPIEAFIEAKKDAKRQAAQKFKRFETLRTRLLENETDALNEVFEQFPLADRQQLRTYIRKAQQEIEQQRPPTYSRKLFRYLVELDESHAT